MERLYDLTPIGTPLLDQVRPVITATISSPVVSAVRRDGDDRLGREAIADAEVRVDVAPAR